MRIQIASDLHLEFFQGRFGDAPTLPFAEGADILVLAGDIHKRDRAIEVFRRWPVPVVYVHGNHEHYKEHIWQNIERLRTRSSGSNVHCLENDVWEYQGVRFLGCALWTDYQVYSNRDVAMAEAASSLNDHQIIRTHYRRFSPVDALAIHLQSRSWIEDKLSVPFDGATVIVTHHAPHLRSVSSTFANDLLTPSFASDLTYLMGTPKLWIHGHVHHSVDYAIDGTRVVANPRGYPLNPRRANTLADVEYENNSFQPILTLDI